MVMINRFMILFVVMMVSARAYAQTPSISDYLIMQNIGGYVWKIQSKDFITGQLHSIPGYSVRSAAGILAGANHFDIDHTDTTYETRYINNVAEFGVEVQVTQHAGGDSDKWLLHEVEDGYRSGEVTRLGLLTQGARLRDVNGNKIISLRGSGYSWVSNQVVVEISYRDLNGNKPEPLEVVQAYLGKFPSTIPVTMVLDRAHDEQWIKDEMDRRLWLGDKWFLQIQTGKADTNKVLKEAVDHMNVFLDYRQKYFGMDGLEEKKALSGFQQKQDGTAIKKKLAEYKTWWEANKGRAINLP